MTEFFFLNFNSHFEAKKILKAKGDQKHLLWSFHVMKLLYIYHNAMVSWDNTDNTILVFVKFKHTFIT